MRNHLSYFNLEVNLVTNTPNFSNNPAEDAEYFKVANLSVAVVEIFRGKFG